MKTEKIYIILEDAVRVTLILTLIYFGLQTQF